MDTLEPIGAMQQQHPQDRKYVTNVKDTMRKIDSGPSVPNETEGKKKNRQVPVDLVEEESMESFPASDPPGHGGNRKDRGDPTRPGQE